MYIYMYSNGLLRMSCVVFCLRNCITSKTLHTVKPVIWTPEIKIPTLSTHLVMVPNGAALSYKLSRKI